MASPLGAARLRPRRRPPTTRISACSGEVDAGSPIRTCANVSSFLRPRRARSVSAIGTAAIASLVRSLARSFGRPAGEALLGPCGRLVARLRLAEPLDQHTAALAVGEEAGAFRAGRILGRAPALVAPAAIVPPQRRVVLAPGIAAARPAGRLVAHLALAPALGCAVALARALGAPAARRLRLGCPLRDRRGEIALRLGNDPGAELLAQHPRAHLLDRALGELAELERTVGDADQPVHLQAEIAEHVPHLAVLALPDRKGEPHVRPLLAVERRLDRPVLDA